MTGKELDDLLYVVDWDNKEAAEALGVSKRTIKNYLNEKRSIPQIVINFIKLQIEYNKMVHCSKNKKD